jgi:hypothetical protein
MLCTRAGCGGFKNAEISSFVLNGTDASGATVAIDLVVYNPSVVAIDSLGNVTLAVFYRDAVLGATAIGPPVSVTNLISTPGLNRCVCVCDAC